MTTMTTMPNPSASSCGASAGAGASSSGSANPAGRAAPTDHPGRRTIDAPTRLTHWLLAFSFTGAWLTAGSELWRALHVTLGYTMAGLLAWRVVYGLVGPRQARLATLWRRVSGLPGWARERMAAWRQGEGLRGAGRQAPHLAMGLAMVGILALIAPLVLSGYGAYQEWGAAWGDGEWLAEVHEFFGNALLWAVGVHLGLIVWMSLQRRQNQALPMLTGRQPGPGPDLVKHNRAGLAAVLLVIVLGFWAWQWQQYPHGLLPNAAAAWAGDHDDD